MTLDKLDHAILNELQTNGRLSYAELGERIGLSKTPCWKRVQRLEQEGMISGYRAEVNPRKVGLNFQVFLNMTIKHMKAEEFEAAIVKFDQITDCFAVAGDSDYLVTVVASDIDEFDDLIRYKFPHLPGVERISTTLTLRTIKSGGVIPIPGTKIE